MIVARTHAWINARCGIRLYFWLSVLAILGLVLCGLPLFNLLGFDYAFVVGLLTALGAADVGHGLVERHRTLAPDLPLGRLAARACLAGASLLALPLLFSLGNALRIRNCNLAAGLAFYALLPLGTALVASQAGLVAALIFPGRRRGRVLAFALPVASLLWSLIRVYRDPAIFALDPFGGYFPGPIYDEALRPSGLLVLYRLSNLTYVAAVLVLVHAFRRRTFRTVLLAAPFLAGSLVWYGYGGHLGFRTSRADLARWLPREIRTTHFVVHADPAAETDNELGRFMRDLEFRYDQLKATLEIEPALPISVYRFPTAAAKKSAVGAAGTLYAKPWAREIYVNADLFPAHHLRHELAHVFASAFGDPIFGVALKWRLPYPRLAFGLVEGLAEAADADDPAGPLTLHEQVLAMQAMGLMPALENALGAGFSLESGPRAYTAVGSFCTYLLDRFGPAALRNVYQSAGDYQAAFGKSLNTLISDYLVFLTTLPKNERATAMAKERFRRPAIFGKVCARELAARVAEAYGLLGTFPQEAVRLLSTACADDPSEPTYQLDLAEALVANRETKQALAILDTLGDDLSAALQQRALDVRAGIAFRTGDRAGARKATEAALGVAGTEGDERTARVKLRALGED